MTKTACPSTEHLANLIKAEILADVRAGVVPETVASFSELHDHVDANCYGGLCFDLYDLLIDFCGGEDEAVALINAAQNEVDAWIKSWHLAAVKEN